MESDLSAYRKRYEKGTLSVRDALADPMAQFKVWFEQAERQALDEPNAMTLSTVDQAGYPSARVVLLKRITAAGFVFFTNYNSYKARAIERHPLVCLSFFWQPMERQVIIRGSCEKTSAAVSDAYFQTRPRGSQLGAWVSQQSKPIASRAALEQQRSTLESRFEGQTIPRPAHWGGYLVRPAYMEFWQGRPDRLHDRIAYTLEAEAWQKRRLCP